MNQPLSPDRRRLWLEAERYHIAEVPEIYRPHPEGLPAITRNCLVVGYPGVGKTMILKKLCADLSTDRDILPIYVQIEPWTAKISGESTYPLDKRQTPRDKDLQSCCTILLALGLIQRIAKYGDFELVAAAAEFFPGQRISASTFADWMQKQISIVRSVLDDGEPLPISYASFVSLFAIANAVGEVARDRGTTLVLLIDQVDKTSAIHFNTVASLLRRGAHVVVVASRPCPSAPEFSTLPAGLVVGNDYAVHWVGCETRSPHWHRFIEDIVRASRFNEIATHLVLENLQSLTSLVGPSARTVLALCLKLERRIIDGTDANVAWRETLTALLDEAEAVAAEVIGAWCTNPQRVISKLRDRSADRRKREHLGPGPASIHIRGSDELFKKPHVEAFLRVCTREGLLIPSSPNQHGLEVILESYEVNPLLIAPRDPAGLSTFDHRVVEFEVTTSELAQWTEHSRGQGRLSPKQVFVSYWMTDPRNAKTLAERLRKGLLDRAEMITGEQFHGSPQWSPAIRGLIKNADVIVLNLSTPRRDVFVEWGWAIGAKRPVLLGVSNARNRDSNPRWARERQIRPFGSDADFGEFLEHLVKMLNTHPNRVAAWIDDPANETMDYKPSTRTVAIVGSGDHWESLVETCNAACHENGFTIEHFSPHQHEDEGGTLFGVIRTARRAGTMILSFDGTEANDFLACVAGGIFTTTDSLTIGNAKTTRRLILLNGAGASSDIVPGLLTNKPGAMTARTVQDAVGVLRDYLPRLNRLIAEARTGSRRKPRRK